MVFAEGSNLEGVQEGRASVPLTTVSQSRVKFEEAELPSLDLLMSFSNGVYRCLYQNCEWKRPLDGKQNLRYKHVSKMNSIPLLMSNRRHIRQHLKPVKCANGFCAYRAAEQVDMYRHVKAYRRLLAERHSGVAENFTCDQCSKPFTRHDNLKRHEKMNICK